MWDDSLGFFIKKDISTLRPHGFAVNLGHHREDCLNPASDMDLFFHIIDCNGVHGTKIHFCHCPGAPDCVEQLMHIQLFPVTLRRLTMAFTLEMLLVVWHG
ncbi:hypothetical protein L208DRAFT_1337531 [Tricholoma matsutake]|nr:hypothetical protein L208DRAFT_1337531 [Tricholoma matsutake 945]